MECAHGLGYDGAAQCLLSQIQDKEVEVREWTRARQRGAGDRALTGSRTSSGSS